MKVLKSKAMITLDESEIAFATDAGIMRNVENRRFGRKPFAGGDPLEFDINGARAEYAVAKYFSLPWSGRIFSTPELKKWRDAGGHDVGPLEVRSTVHRTKLEHMPMFRTDYKDVPYTFVIVHSPEKYEIRGWLWGREGMQADYWDDPARFNRPYYCVPMHILHPIGELEYLISSGGVKV
jgi:hypothetical protein